MSVKSYSCQCLNVRLFRVVTISRVVVVHPELVDITISKEEHDSRLKGHFVCVLCGFQLFEFPLYASHRDHSSIAIEFQRATQESVTIPRQHIQQYDQYWLTEDQTNAVMYSCAYSKTFRVSLSFKFAGSSFGGEHPIINSNTDQLSRMISSFCNLVIDRLFVLQIDNLAAGQLELGNCLAQFSMKAKRMISEFQTLSRLICLRYFEDRSPGIDYRQTTEELVGFHTAKIRTCFQTLYTQASKHSSSTAAVGLLSSEGASSGHHIGAQQQARLSSSGSAPFSSLPAETAWKILEFLQPEYVSVELTSANQYCTEYSSFARLVLVSRSWAEMVLPLLYHTIVLFGNLESLNKLVTTLKVRGPLVRTIIVDDVGMSHEHGGVHLWACKQSINKTLECCRELLHLKCYGYLQMGTQDPLRPNPKNHIKSLTLKLPYWTPFDVSEALSHCAESLEHLEISHWKPDALVPAFSPASSHRLPRCRSIALREGIIGEDQVTTLLSSAVSSIDGKSTLRRLYLIDMRAILPHSILSLLRLNEMFSTLTELSVRLELNVQRTASNDLPIKLLKLCPSLVSFSYTSLVSVEVFQYLPPSLEVLELAVMLPIEISPATPTAVPSITSLRPFLEHVLSGERSARLRRLSIVRRLPDYNPNSHPWWQRLGVQFWDSDDDSLRDACRLRQIRLDCALSFV